MRQPARRGGKGGGSVTDVATWHHDLNRSAGLRSQAGASAPPVVCFRAIDGRIEPPALEADILSIHLGGPKRVIRRGSRRRLEVDVLQNSFTTMPAQEPFSWETFGPIHFAHLRIDRTNLDRVAIEDFDRDPGNVRLAPVVGVNDPLVFRLFEALLTNGRDLGLARLYHDAFSVVLSRNLLERYVNGGRSMSREAPARGKLATWQLRRVIEYMRVHVAEDIELGTLVELTGLGRARFFETFKTTMGRTPFAYLIHLRLLRARMLLTGTQLSITEVAAEVGLEPTRLAVAFRRVFNTTPSAFRAANAS